MNLRFDQPELLWLGLLSLPLVVFGWRWLANLDRFRRATVLLLRTAVVVSLAVILAGPRTVREHDNLTVIGVLGLLAIYLLGVADPLMEASRAMAPAG